MAEITSRPLLHVRVFGSHSEAFHYKTTQDAPHSGKTVKIHPRKTRVETMSIELFVVVVRLK